jgi:hypothetical protein
MGEDRWQRIIGDYRIDFQSRNITSQSVPSEIMDGQPYYVDAVQEHLLFPLVCGGSSGAVFAYFTIERFFVKLRLNQPLCSLAEDLPNILAIVRDAQNNPFDELLVTHDETTDCLASPAKRMRS